jgi:hypothetical protein
VPVDIHACGASLSTRRLSRPLAAQALDGNMHHVHTEIGDQHRAAFILTRSGAVVFFLLNTSGREIWCKGYKRSAADDAASST